MAYALSEYRPESILSTPRDRYDAKVIKASLPISRARSRLVRLFRSVRLAQVENLLPNFFVFGELPIFLFAQAVDGCNVNRFGGSDFWICRYPALDAKSFLSFIRSGPAMKQ